MFSDNKANVILCVDFREQRWFILWLKFLVLKAMTNVKLKLLRVFRWVYEDISKVHIAFLYVNTFKYA